MAERAADRWVGDEMDDTVRSEGEGKQRSKDVQALLAMVERRSVTADQFHSACAILFAGQDAGRRLSATISAVAEGQESMAELIAAVTVPDQFEWSGERVIIWVEDGEAQAEVNLREGRTMRVALTEHGLAAERFDRGEPVASLRRTYDELLPAPH